MAFFQKKRKILLILSGIVLLLVITPYLFFQFYKKSIEQTLEKEIDESLTAVVTFDNLSFSIFHNFPNLTLTLQKVNVVGTEKFKDDTLAYAKEIDLELNLYKIIAKNTIELKSIALNEPLINILVLKSGEANYNIFISDTLQENKDTTSHSAISLERFIIKKGRINYQDQTTGMLIEMVDVDHIGKGDFTADIFDYSTDTKIQKFSFYDGNIKYFHQKKIAIDLIMEMNIKEKSFTFKENTFGVNHFVFGMHGRVAILPTGYDLNIVFASQEAAFKDILSLIPGVFMEDFKEITTEGMVAFNGFAKGKYVYGSPLLPIFHVEVIVKDAMFKVDSLSIPIKDIQFDLRVDNKTGDPDSTIFDLRTFHMNIDGDPVHGRCKVQGLQAMNIDTDILAEIDLRKLEDIYPIKALDVEGKINVELKAKGIYQSKQDKNGLVLQKIPLFHLTVALRDG
ncbi:MAG: AsmA family protein, partial [Cytophagales bacterium]|nr:AsmA family protein [Cytophaga sp.]